MVGKFLEDAISPVAREIGEGLADLVNLAFTPIQKLKYVRDQNLEDFKKKLEARVKEIPEEKLTEAPPEIVGPILEDVGKYYHNQEYLRMLFSSLISATMNLDKRAYVHPSYKAIIEQISSDEAKLLRYLFYHPYFKNWRYPLVGIKYIPGHIADEKMGTIIKKLKGGAISIHGTSKSIKEFDLGFTLTNYVALDAFYAHCEEPEKFPQYIENLTRLKILDVVIGKSLYHYEKEYSEIIQSDYIDQIIKNNFFAKNGKESFYVFPLNYYEITGYGLDFMHCCL